MKGRTPKLWIVALFALFHGHAHGNEVPEMASPGAYVLGFVVATGLLHLVGIGLARGFRRLPRWSDLSVRVAGGAVAACGLVLILGGIVLVVAALSATRRQRVLVELGEQGYRVDAPDGVRTGKWADV